MSLITNNYGLENNGTSSSSSTLKHRRLNSYAITTPDHKL